MEEASISMNMNQFKCLVCLDLLKDPVTTPCGHSFCKVCINSCWDQEDVKGVYSCPGCKQTFTPRPVSHKNNMPPEVVEKLKKPEPQAAFPAYCYAGPGDVECDFCTGIKRKAVNSCLVCLASYCKDHLQPHDQSPAFKKHKLVEACTDLQEKICSEHDKLMEIYCRTDQSLICYLCMMDQHKGHDTVTAKAERTEKQSELKEEQMKSQQRIQEKQKKIKDLKQTVDSIKRHSQAAVNHSERIFTELIRFMEKKCLEATEQIRAQEKTELRRAEQVLNQLEQEIADLQRRVTELEQLSHTDDDIHFLQSFPSLRVSPGCDDSPSFTVNQRLSFDGVRKSLSDLKKQLGKIFAEKFNKIPPEAAEVQIDLLSDTNMWRGLTAMQDAAVQMILPPGQESREDFLQYFLHLTLDRSTAHPELELSDQNRTGKRVKYKRQYDDNSKRFDSWCQVLCKESVRGRCYWEVEWNRRHMGVDIAVTYKNNKKKGKNKSSKFGHNSQSWSLQCSSSSLCFWHNDVKTVLKGPASSRIGVYVDYNAGTLSFYSVFDNMSLLYRVHTTFTQPLKAGFRISYYGSTMRLKYVV